MIMKKKKRNNTLFEVNVWDQPTGGLIDSMRGTERDMKSFVRRIKRRFG